MDTCRSWIASSRLFAPVHPGPGVNRLGGISCVCAPTCLSLYWPRSCHQECNMSQLEFGLFDWFYESADGAAEILEEHLTRAKLAEDLGYKYCFFTEHQNSPDGVNTSANIYLAALARETST